MADELVHYDVVGGTATITLDSPHNRNALSAQLRRELSDSLAKAVTQAYEQRQLWQASVAKRLQERQALADAHRQLYLDVLAEHSNVLTLQ